MSEQIIPYKAGAALRYAVDNAFTDEAGIFHRLRRRGFASEKEARAWSRRAELATREGHPQEPRKRPSGASEGNPAAWTTRQVWEAVLDLTRGRLKETTWRKHQGSFRVHVAHVIGDKTFSKISARDFQILASNKYAVPFVRHLLLWAPRVGAVLPEVVFDAPPRKVNQRLLWLEPDEARRALELLPDKFRPMFLLCVGLGLRLGEAAGLQWGDIDHRRGLVTVARQYSLHGKLTTTKSGRVRVVPLSDLARRGLDMLTRGAAGDLLFPGLRFAFAQALRDIRPALGKEVCAHSLRHSYASWQIQAGVSLSVVAKLLGHSTAHVTETYSHLAPRHLQDGVKALDAAFSC